MKSLLSVVKLFAILLLLFSLQNCAKEVEREFPRIRTLPCKILPNGALLKGEISNYKSMELDEYGFLFCKGEFDQDSDLSYINVGSELGSSEFEFALTTGLIEGEIYTFFAYAISNEILSVGDEYGFISGGSDPPELISYSPTEGFVGDSVRIYLNKFYGSSSEYSVSFNDISAAVVRYNDSTLALKVPLSLRDLESTISVSAFEETASFTEKFSLAIPNIISFSPDEVFPGEIVTIAGNIFPEDKNVLSVYFNNKKGTVISSSRTSISVNAPAPSDSINTIKVEVVSGQFDIAEETIKIIFPSGNYFFPISGTFGNQVTIYGDGIGLYPIENIMFNSTLATIISVESNEIIVSVPPGLQGCDAQIIVNYESIGPLGFFDPFTLNQVEISSLESTDVAIGTELIIYGNNFNPGSTLVKVGDQFLTPHQSSTSQLSVIISGLVEEGMQPLSVQSCDGYVDYPGGVNILPSVDWVWQQVANFPGGKAYKVGSFVIGDYGYAGLGTRVSHSHVTGIWKYDPGQNTWNEIAQFPGVTRVHPHGFEINGLGYMGGGFDADAPTRNNLTDFYEYDPTLNNWTAIESYQGETDTHFHGISEVVSGKCYISFTSEDFYSFTPNGSPVWQKLSNPDTDLFSYSSSFVLGDKIYVLCGLEDNGTVSYNSLVWVYNTSTDTWQQMSDFPGGDRCYGSAFEIGNIGYYGLGYFGTGYYGDMWKYSEASDTWSNISLFPGGARTLTFDLVFNNQVFIGTGLGVGSTFYQDMYRYSPVN